MKQWISRAPTGRLFHSGIRTPLGRITWAGRHLDHPVIPRMAMRYWDTYSLVYVIRGQARFHDQAGLDLPVSAGDLMLMFPRHGYRYRSDPKQPWSEVFIQFKGPLFGLWTKENLLSPERPLHHLEPVEHWWQRLETIIKPTSIPEPAQSLKRICLLQEFLVDAVITPRAETRKPEDHRWVARARTLLDASPGKPADWPAISRQLGFSYDRFRKQFTAWTGIPPARYRAARQIEYAEDLLNNPVLSLKQIATTCGFFDVFHFSRRFKDLTGLTPVQFRRRLM